MRQERIIQATIFEVFAEHEIGRELKAISQWLDEHVRCWVWRSAICAGTGPAKRKQGPGLIASQSKIKDVKVMPHVSAVFRSGERQHP